MKKNIFTVFLLLSIGFFMNAQNSFPPSGDARINGSLGVGDFINYPYGYLGKIHVQNEVITAPSYGSTGIFSSSSALHNTGVLSKVQAAWLLSLNGGTGTLNESIGLSTISGNESSGTGTVNNAFGVHIDVQNGNGTVTNGYGLYIKRVLADNSYGIYQKGLSTKNYFEGNVGVGTTNPDAKFHIETLNVGKKSSYADLIIESTDAQLDLTSSSDGVWGSSINFVEGVNSTSNKDIWSIIRQTTNGTGNSDLYFKFGTSDDTTQNEAKMVVKTDGNVGIGTTTPSEKLEVFGANPILKITQNPGISGGGGIVLKGAGSGPKSFVQFHNGGSIWSQSGGNGTNRLEFGSSDRTNTYMTVLEGKVGIGTTNPQQKLQIGDNGFTLHDGGHKVLTFNPYTNNYGSIRYDVQNKRFTVETVIDGVLKNYLHTASNGNVIVNHNLGIGIASPEKKLHIEGTPWTGIKIRDITTSGGRGIQNDYLDGNNDGWRMTFAGHYPGQPLNFAPMSGGVQGSASISLFDNGSVGIGTAKTGTYELAVGGEIRAEEIKVDTGWADFVFEKDYSLPTLKEVENHINKKGHLKDIPSAKDVKENGIFLGEMNAKLLQKIEELTLYTIQQQKEIKVLKDQNSKTEKFQKDIEVLKKENKVLKSLLERVSKLEEKIENKN